MTPETDMTGSAREKIHHSVGLVELTDQLRLYSGEEGFPSKTIFGRV